MSNTIKIPLKKDQNYLFVPIGGQLYDSSNTPLIHDGIGFTGRGDGLHQEQGVIIFIDALGMKRIWNTPHFDPRHVINRWDIVINSFQNSLDAHRQYLNTISYFRVLSDTMIIAIPANLSYGLIGQIFELLLGPFIDSLKVHMLLRGAISYGTYYLSRRLIIGPAIADAATCHDKMDWIGISLTPSLTSKIYDINKIGTKSAIYYTSIPHKDTPYSGLVLNWPDFDSKRECLSILQNEGHLSPDVAKYQNTFIFYEAVMNST